tara:strand:- start:129149 stop:130270 length:1122 start_codon:yes stop_codon:yes gene_type:complete
MEFKFLIKKLNNSLSKEEEIMFDEWHNASADHRLYFENVKENYKKDIELVNIEKAWDSLYNKIVLKPKKIVNWKYAAAAVIILLLSIPFVINKLSTKLNQTPIIVNNNIAPGIDKAILTLENGEKVALIKGTSFQTQNATSDGEELVYNNSTSRELVYNYLNVPRGGQFFLKLSDGTQVWLNSESQLKYPVNFVEGETREVELVYGEAYFDVSPSTQHKGSRFKVYHNQQEVQVLGTEFNIKAYKDEINIYTTLIEGKVAVSFKNQNKILKPGEQSNLNVITKMLVINNTEVYDQISWKEGVFSFKRKSLKEIMQVLSRWYDMKVDFKNKELEKLGFNGVLGKGQNIQEILETIKNFGVIENYEINNKTITLK